MSTLNYIYKTKWLSYFLSTLHQDVSWYHIWSCFPLFQYFSYFFFSSIYSDLLHFMFSLWFLCFFKMRACYKHSANSYFILHLFTLGPHIIQPSYTFSFYFSISKYINYPRFFLTLVNYAFHISFLRLILPLQLIPW